MLVFSLFTAFFPSLYAKSTIAYGFHIEQWAVAKLCTFSKTCHYENQSEFIRTYAFLKTAFDLLCSLRTSLPSFTPDFISLDVYDSFLLNMRCKSSVSHCSLPRSDAQQCVIVYRAKANLFFLYLFICYLALLDTLIKCL